MIPNSFCCFFSSNSAPAAKASNWRSSDVRNAIKTAFTNVNVAITKAAIRIITCKGIRLPGRENVIVDLTFLFRATLHLFFINFEFVEVVATQLSHVECTINYIHCLD